MEICVTAQIDTKSDFLRVFLVHFLTLSENFLEIFIFLSKFEPWVKLEIWYLPTSYFWPSQVQYFLKSKIRLFFKNDGVRKIFLDQENLRYFLSQNPV